VIGPATCRQLLARFGMPSAAVAAVPDLAGAVAVTSDIATGPYRNRIIAGMASGIMLPKLHRVPAR